LACSGMGTMIGLLSSNNSVRDEMTSLSIRPSTFAAGLTCSYFKRWISSRSPASYLPYATAFAKGGASLSQLPQRAMPSAKERQCLLVKRSPHRPQTKPSIGWIARMQDSHTGKREILVRGTPHRRQSDGKMVANKLSAAAPSRATIADCDGGDSARTLRV